MAWRLLSDLVTIIGELELMALGSKALLKRSKPAALPGKLVFHVFAALAEFERDLIRERAKVGGGSEYTGRKGGRKPALTASAAKEIKQLLKDLDIEVVEAAKRYGVSRATIYNV